MVLEKQCGIACPDYDSPYCDDCWDEWEAKQEALDRNRGQGERRGGVMNEKRFWMVWRETSQNSSGFDTTPARKHNTPLDAHAEAIRLCTLEGDSFYVVEAIERIQLDERPVKVILLT